MDEPEFLSIAEALFKNERKQKSRHLHQFIRGTQVSVVLLAPKSALVKEYSQASESTQGRRIKANMEVMN